MAKNDKLLIDGIIDDRIDQLLPSNKRDEAFEFLVFEQLLKGYDLSVDELKHGNIDGRNDGGIDGFFIFINGHYLSDPQSFKWPKSGTELEVFIITCKHHETFKQAPLDNLAASTSELLDFSIQDEKLKGDYSEAVLRMRQNLKFAYRKSSPRLSKFEITFCYGSRGIMEEIGESIVSRSNQITKIANDSFGNCKATFKFIGSSELIELYRKTPNFSLELPFIEALSRGERYVLLVNLKDYFHFVNDTGNLRRYLFDSNVRAFMGLNRVNDDIKTTLTNPDSPDFWWLNNGVTILSTGATIVGKSIQVEDIQIVNGLQTTESIFRHFINEGLDPNERSVLVKIIVSNDASVRDAIIRATNNQTIVELASLHATDKIQRDIEEVLKRNDIYYERRTNFYKNQGIPSSQIIRPLYIASGYVNLVLKQPHRATTLKSRFMRSESAYDRVFSEATDLNVWPKIVSILKKTDKYLEKTRDSNKGGERYLKSNRQFLSFILISKIYGTFNFNINDLIKLDLKKLNDKEFEEVWELINHQIPIRKKNTITYLHNLCQKAVDKWGIDGIKRILNVKQLKTSFNRKRLNTSKAELTSEFIEQVNQLLPIQPWKPGVHLEVTSKLNCSRGDYFSAVEVLIEEGKRNKQKDGVVYDVEGNILAFDEERVDSETLELINKIGD